MNSYFLSPNCFIYNVSDKLSLDDNLKILTICRDIFVDKTFLTQNSIYDLVPTYNSIAFHFSRCDVDNIDSIILNRISKVDFDKPSDSTTHHIDVHYNGEDLAKVASQTCMTIEQVIQKHIQNTYHIAMLGFKPYFPYLLGMDEVLKVPRLDKPRNRVSKGSIGIGGMQTAIFTTDTPSGWNMIGKTDFDDFSKFTAGDKIIFRSV